MINADCSRLKTVHSDLYQRCINKYLQCLAKSKSSPSFPGFLTPEYVTESTSVIDVGINSKGGQITGDADFEKLAPLVRAITPVPGGVGAVTSTMVFSNLMAARNLKPGK